MDRICSCYSERATYRGHRKTIEHSSVPPGYPKWRNKRKRIKCPKCGRRVFARISFCHDGCCTIYSLPPHKRKHWWKSNKRTHAKDIRKCKKDFEVSNLYS